MPLVPTDFRINCADHCEQLEELEELMTVSVPITTDLNNVQWTTDPVTLNTIVVNNVLGKGATLCSFDNQAIQNALISGGICNPCTPNFPGNCSFAQLAAASNQFLLASAGTLCTPCNVTITKQGDVATLRFDDNIVWNQPTTFANTASCLNAVVDNFTNGFIFLLLGQTVAEKFLPRPNNERLTFPIATGEIQNSTTCGTGIASSSLKSHIGLARFELKFANPDAPAIKVWKDITAGADASGPTNNGFQSAWVKGRNYIFATSVTYQLKGSTL